MRSFMMDFMDNKAEFGLDLMLSSDLLTNLMGVLTVLLGVMAGVIVKHQ